MILGMVCLVRQLSSEWEATRIEALQWISILLDRHRIEVTRLFSSSILIYYGCSINILLDVYIIEPNGIPILTLLSLETFCCLCPMYRFLIIGSPSVQEPMKHGNFNLLFGHED